MADAPHDAADHLLAAQALMPTGAVWPRQAGTVQERVLSGLAAGVARLHARARALLVDAFPSTALELLGEWEASLGLPDPCAGAEQTVQQRRAAVVSRLTGRGGQSAGYFIGVAAALGYVVTIEQFAAFRFGESDFGDPLADEAWAHAWRIRAPAETVRAFRFGESVFGESFAVWGNAALECAMQRVAPAHTVLLFAYGD